MTDQRLNVPVQSRHARPRAINLEGDRDVRLECSMESNPVPAILCRLRDLRYVMVNRRFLDLTDSADEDWLNRSMHERDLLEGVTCHDPVKRNLRAGQTIAPTATTLVLPNGRDKRVTVAGQPVTVGGQSHMLFTLTDVEPWHRIEQLHRQSETTCRTMFEESPSSMMMVDADDQVIEMANASLSALLGYPVDEILGRSVADIDIWPSGIRSGIVRTKCGALLDCAVSMAIVTIANRTCHLWTLQDVTRRRIDERNLAAAIETTLSEAQWLSRAVMDNLVRSSEPAREIATSGLNDLTTRERDVLALICQGMDDKTMARTLNVSSNTVRNHIARVYGKIGVNRRIAAAAWARARGFDGETERTTLLLGR